MKAFLSLLLMFSFQVSMAASTEMSAKTKTKITKEKIDELALKFHMNKAADLVKNVALMNCEEPSLGDCVNKAAVFIPSHEMNDKAEIMEVTRACMGNINGKCLTTVASLIPSYEMNDRDEVIQILNACKGYQTSECLEVVSKSIPSYDINDRQEVIEVLNSCSGR